MKFNKTNFFELKCWSEARSITIQSLRQRERERNEAIRLIPELITYFHSWHISTLDTWGTSTMRISEVANAVQWINTHKEAVTEADSWPLPNKAVTDIKTNISRFLKDEKRNPSHVMPARPVQLPVFMCSSIQTFGTWGGKRGELLLKTWSCFQKVSSKPAIPCLLFHWSDIVCLAP